MGSWREENILPASETNIFRWLIKYFNRFSYGLAVKTVN